MLDHLNEFAAVVEHESVNKASLVLNISQPALSRKIMKLEEELGISLFERKGKRLELTRIGRICYEYALEARQLEEQLKKTLSDYKRVGQSRMTIGASLTTLQSTLPDLIALFSAEFPGMDIKALTGKTHEVVAMVKEKKVDLGIVASSIDHPGLSCIPLFEDHLCLVVPSSHSFSVMERIEVKQLNGLPMILFSNGTWYRILMDELFRRYAIHPDVRMEIDSFEAIIRLVATTKTATLLPKSYLHLNLLENNELAVRDVEELARTKRTTSLIYADGSELSPTTRQLIEKTRVFFLSVIR